MSDLILTKTRLFEGVWEGVITRRGDGKEVPEVEVTYQQDVLPDVQITTLSKGQGWALHVPVPASVIADGIQTFLIVDTVSQETIGSFSLMAGEALGYDIRAEVTLLREELDMLKRAFRRHCLETM